MVYLMLVVLVALALLSLVVFWLMCMSSSSPFLNEFSAGWATRCWLVSAWLSFFVCGLDISTSLCQYVLISRLTPIQKFNLWHTYHLWISWSSFKYIANTTSYICGIQVWFNCTHIIYEKCPRRKQGLNQHTHITLWG